MIKIKDCLSLEQSFYYYDNIIDLNISYYVIEL